MFYSRRILLLALVPLGLPILTLGACPLAGPNFPSPKQLTSNQLFQSHITNLTGALDDAAGGRTQLKQYVILDNTTSFAVEAFSTHTNDSLLSYTWSSPILQQTVGGVKTVTRDSIFRVGSITKLFTVYLMLLNDGYSHFHEPVTKWVPELAQLVQGRDVVDGTLDAVAWDEVMIGDLASQISGIGRDYGLQSEQVLASVSPDFDAATALGYPALNDTELPLCGVSAENPQCSRSEFFQEFGTKHPVYAPSTAPIYSNAAFQILGYAFEGMTGRSVAAAFKEDIIEPLGMSHTHYNITPDDDLGVIPLNASVSWWSVPLGDESPAGSFYSSVSDLAVLGRTILSSSQLPKRLTRRWMKPVSFTSSPVFSVGAPWEIFRIEHDSNMVDIYTKLGGLGAYASVLILIPQYDFGVTVLAAGADPTTTVLQVSNFIVDDLIPVMEDIARQEADTSFAGTYTTQDGLDSKIVIETVAGIPGLLVTTFTSNGTDMLTSNANTTLFPTGLTDTSGRVVAFRALVDKATRAPPGAIDFGCASWTQVDALSYGSVSLDEVVFDFDENGNALSVAPLALRATFVKGAE